MEYQLGEEAVDERGEKARKSDGKKTTKVNEASVSTGIYVAPLRYDQIRCAGEQTSPQVTCAIGHSPQWG